MKKSRRCEPLFSDEDSDLRAEKWSHDSKGYAITFYHFRKTATDRARTVGIFAHRIVLRRMLGRSLVEGEFTDHANGNRLDNRRSNLRLATVKQNAQNRRSHGASGLRGVSPFRGKWQARVRHDGRDYHCGTFATVEEAAEAARLNRVELGFFGESEEKEVP